MQGRCHIWEVFSYDVSLPLSLLVPGLTKLRMPTAEFLDSIGPALHLHMLLHPWSSYFCQGSKNLFCEDASPRAGPTSLEQGPFLALGRTTGLGWKLFFFHGNGIQIGTLCLVPLCCRARLDPDLAFQRSADSLISKAFPLNERLHTYTLPVRTHSW